MPVPFLDEIEAGSGEPGLANGGFQAVLTVSYSVSVFKGNVKVASAARRKCAAPVQARCAAPKLPRTKKSRVSPSKTETL